jgi:aspartyl protease family protein
MGLTHLRVTVANPAKPRRSTTIRLMVDSGALYSVVPATTLRRLGIEPHGSRTFILADGTEIKRKMGAATFRVARNTGTSSVIFGEEDDAALLGIVSLEDLGLMLDPLKRVLRPLPMVLGGQART